MEKSILLSLGTLAAVGVTCLLVGCGASQDASYINEPIAEAYQEFYDLGASDPAGAMAALERAEKADPANAYTQFLKASAMAQKDDLEGALSVMEEAVAMPKVVHYVKVPPPGDEMQSLMRIRQLGFSTEKADKLGERAPDYFSAVKAVGAKVANSEPLTSLGVINGVGVIRRTLSSEVAYWEGRKDEAKAEEARARAEIFAEWQDAFTKSLSENLLNFMKEAGKAAGLSEQELMDYAGGKELADKGKQKRADEARQKIYEQEIESLRRSLKSMPKV